MSESGLSSARDAANLFPCETPVLVGAARLSSTLKIEFIARSRMRWSVSVPDGSGSFISDLLIFPASFILFAMNPKDERRATLVGPF